MESIIQIYLQQLYQRLPHYLCILVWYHLLTWGLSENDLAEEGFFLIPQKKNNKKQQQKKNKKNENLFNGIIEFWILPARTRALRIVNPLL